MRWRRGEMALGVAVLRVVMGSSAPERGWLDTSSLRFRAPHPVNVLPATDHPSIDLSPRRSGLERSDLVPGPKVPVRCGSPKRSVFPNQRTSPRVGSFSGLAVKPHDGRTLRVSVSPPRMTVSMMASSAIGAWSSLQNALSRAMSTRPCCVV
jgi:hypothetical protein